MDGRGCHLVGRSEEQSLTLAVGNRQPAHLLFGTVFLRQDIILVLVSDGALIDGRQTSLLTVTVTVPRTSSEPRQLFHLLRHLQFEAKFRQDGTRVLRTDERVDHQRTVGTDDEVETHIESVRATAIGALHAHGDGLAVFCLRHVGRGALGRTAELGQVHAVPGTFLAAIIIRG